MKATILLAALLLAACITGYSREAPLGVFPAGELSGAPIHFVGWRIRL